MKLELQNDATNRRTNTADYETQGGEVIGLTESELIAFKDLLDLDYDNARCEWQEFSEDANDYLTVISSKKDPDILFYEYETEGGFYGCEYSCGICDKLMAIDMLEAMRL